MKKQLKVSVNELKVGDEYIGRGIITDIITERPIGLSYTIRNVSFEDGFSRMFVADDEPVWSIFREIEEAWPKTVTISSSGLSDLELTRYRDSSFGVQVADKYLAIGVRDLLDGIYDLYPEERE